MLTFIRALRVMFEIREQENTEGNLYPRVKGNVAKEARIHS